MAIGEKIAKNINPITIGLTIFPKINPKSIQFRLSDLRMRGFNIALINSTPVKTAIHCA
jgi:hypothetical protein